MSLLSWWRNRCANCQGWGYVAIGWVCPDCRGTGRRA